MAAQLCEKHNPTLEPSPVYSPQCPMCLVEAIEVLMQQTETAREGLSRLRDRFTDTYQEAW